VFFFFFFERKWFLAKIIKPLGYILILNC